MKKLYDWFKSLSASERIDVMCNLFGCCLPVELYFFHTYLIDLCENEQKLKELQEEVNRSSYYSSFTKLSDFTTRRKALLSCGLLYGRNFECSNEISRFIRQDLKVGSDSWNFLIKNDIVAEEILLLLTIIINHPAFSFNQKSEFFELICSFEQRCKNLEEIPLSQNGQSCAKISSEPKLEKFESKTMKEGLFDFFAEKASAAKHFKPIDDDFHKNISKQGKIRNLEVKKSAKKKAYRIEVTWHDGKKTEIVRTYREISLFHKELVQHFPNEAHCSGPQVYIPALLEVDHNVNSSETFAGQSNRVKDYLRKFACHVPVHVKDSEYVINFFQSTSNNRVPPILVGSSNFDSRLFMKDVPPRYLQASLDANQKKLRMAEAAENFHRPSLTQADSKFSCNSLLSSVVVSAGCYAYENSPFFTNVNGCYKNLSHQNFFKAEDTATKFSENTWKEKLKVMKNQELCDVSSDASSKTSTTQFKRDKVQMKTATKTTPKGEVINSRNKNSNVNNESLLIKRENKLHKNLVENAQRLPVQLGSTSVKNLNPELETYISDTSRHALSDVQMASSKKLPASSMKSSDLSTNMTSESSYIENKDNSQYIPAFTSTTNSSRQNCTAKTQTARINQPVSSLHNTGYIFPLHMPFMRPAMNYVSNSSNLIFFSSLSKNNSDSLRTFTHTPNTAMRAAFPEMVPYTESSRANHLNKASYSICDNSSHQSRNCTLGKTCDTKIGTSNNYAQPVTKIET